MPTPFISTRTMVGLQEGLVQCIGERSVKSALSAEDLPGFAFETTRAYIPQLAQIRFFERTARDAGVENLGFVLGQSASVRQYGVFGDYVTSTPTFSDALHLTSDMMSYHSSLDRLSVQHERDILQLTYHSAFRNVEGYPHYAMLAVSVLLTIANPFFGQALRRKITFNFPKPRHTGPYEEFFGCPVAFDQPQLAIFFDDEAGQQTLRKKPETIPTLRDVVRDAMGPAPTNLVGSVRAILQANISGTNSIDTVARQLDYSERSLRRRLDEVGMSFRELAQKARVDRATELLLGSHLDVSEISQLVGYSDPSHFGRAFRQLTGLTPSAARRASTPNFVAGNG